MNITVTENANEFLKDLLSKQDNVLGVKLLVNKAGTPKAETLLTYAREDTIDEADTILHFGELTVYIDNKSEPFLEDALVNYDSEMMGGNLTIKAPNSKLPKISENSTLEEKVNYTIWNDIYPMVAPHGGEVSLVEITEDKVAILSFGGGYQGCAQVDVTLKYGVEEELMKQIPELTGVKDITDHTDRSNSYY
jgi:Fe/S biogenesis protein NfuA